MHYSPERFWSIYDRERYERVERRLDPGKRSPTVLEKLGRVE